MVLQGKVFKFGDNINTDWIISGRYKFSITDMKKLAQYLFEDIRPHFYKEVVPGKSIIVAGQNFGMGSSREQAPWVIKEAGIVCIVAKSFARIFYRNAFNIGLPLVETDTESLSEGDELTVEVDKGIVTSAPAGVVLQFNPWNTFRKELVNCGGIINYLQKHKDFKLN
ncbi:MAG: 3-isopropylmalate dehydratase small subunit [Candidatus Omnitrophota bacterium]|nr:3-isopropylmalate dehydratase small subunit [Candidatus Omnitrophota bacterium]